MMKVVLRGKGAPRPKARMPTLQEDILMFCQACDISDMTHSCDQLENKNVQHSIFIEWQSWTKEKQSQVTCDKESKEEDKEIDNKDGCLGTNF